MATLAGAKAKYRSKLSSMPANYATGMAQFLGIPASQVSSSPPGMSYSGKMKAGIEDKWEDNLRNAFNTR